MRKIFFLLFIFISITFFSQEKDEQVYTIVEEQPEFPGGPAEMYKFINNNIVFPKSALNDSTFIGGKTFVKFIITEKGDVESVQIIKGCKGCSACDEESLRIVKMMPKWKPGQQSGKQVKVYYNLPFNFKK